LGLKHTKINGQKEKGDDYEYTINSPHKQSVLVEFEKKINKYGQVFKKL
jgi:hypothetical protein